jgi:hypothetical protein
MAEEAQVHVKWAVEWAEIHVESAAAEEEAAGNPSIARAKA